MAYKKLREYVVSSQNAENMYIIVSPELLHKATRDLMTEFRPQKTLRGWSAITLNQTQHG